jgi:hypothetical protein
MEDAAQIQINKIENRSESERSRGVLSILPVHDAPFTGDHQLKIARSPGRPRKVERMPTTSDLQYHALMSEEKGRFLDSDPIVLAIGRSDPADKNLQRIKLEIARESASLHFQRIEMEKHGKDTSQISTRRIDALERIARLELKIKEADKDSVSLGGEKMQKIFMLWVETMREIATEVLKPEEMDLFFNRFATAMEGWEEKAQNVLR